MNNSTGGVGNHNLNRLTKSETSAVNHRIRYPTLKKMTYAFGSSTPREFSYLSHVPLRYRVYDVKLRSRRRKGEPTLSDYMREVRSESRPRTRDRSLDSSLARVYVFGSSTPRDWSHLERVPADLRIYDTKLRRFGNDKRSKTISFSSGGSSATEKKYGRRTSSMEMLPIEENVSSKSGTRPRKTRSATRKTVNLKSPNTKSPKPFPNAISADTMPTVFYDQGNFAAAGISVENDKVSFENQELANATEPLHPISVEKHIENSIAITENHSDQPSNPQENSEQHIITPEAPDIFNGVEKLAESDNQKQEQAPIHEYGIAAESPSETETKTNVEQEAEIALSNNNEDNINYNPPANFESPSPEIQGSSSLWDHP